ncbi:MAG: DinB family protein [Acidobacteria bacterium]|nr:MAG: DinB family protein [Acidobacteriota bacterium]
MDNLWRSVVWQQFSASIDMLENALLACPDDLWSDASQKPQFRFWYLVYHTVFYLDVYSSDSLETFAPPAPFTLSELDPAGELPERVYTKDELQTYLDYGRRKCRAMLESLSDEKAQQRCGFEWERDLSVAELVLDNLRHVQHHVAQLNLLLRQRTGSAPPWVSKSATA